MKHRPVVALVGRPNVGKSSLFNRLIGRRVAIVEDQPGVTRDRIYGDCRWRDRTVTVVDTGGIDPYATEDIAAQSRGQAQIAVAEADVIVLVVDGREGVHSAGSGSGRTAAPPRQTRHRRRQQDRQSRPRSRTVRVRILRAGLGRSGAVSAEHGRNTGELLDRVFDAAARGAEDEDGMDPISIAIVGRPNVGKSSLVNALAGEERAIVSDVPGTTRDVVDTRLEWDGTPFILLDTAGLRRKSRVDTAVEHYSVVRAVRAVERCDVAVVVLDATEELAEQDKRVIGIAHEAGKGLVIAVNKWDLVEKDSAHHGPCWRSATDRNWPSPLTRLIVFISAKTGQRVERVLELARTAANFAALRLRTGQFNEVLQEAAEPADRRLRTKACSRRFSTVFRPG